MFTIVVDAAGVGEEIPLTGFRGEIVGRDRLLQGTDDRLRKRLEAFDDRSLEIYLKACPVLWSPEFEPKKTDDVFAYVGRFKEIYIDKREVRYTFTPYEGLAAIPAQQLQEMDRIFQFNDWGWHRTRMVAFDDDVFGLLGSHILKSQLVPLKSEVADHSLPEAIFIVHGHDEASANKVRIKVHAWTGIMPTVLGEQAGGGRTIIEKFERAAKASNFALVMLTPDDEGRAKSSTTTDLLSRARQNVILELGYFYAALGRNKVAVLYQDVELPSDINGVNYIRYGSSEWTDELRMELIEAGFTLKG